MLSHPIPLKLTTTHNGSMKGLKVVFLNIDRLYDWLDELRMFANEHAPHIICLNETKLNQDTQDELLAIQGFQNIVRKDRNKMAGRVTIYVENNLKFRVREDLITDFDSISIELEVKYVKPIVVTTVYRPPGSCVELFHKIETELISKIDAESKECIFTGDMNCDLLKPRDNDTKNLKRIYNNYHFKQLITEPTRVTSDTSTIIDHISTNKPDRVLTRSIIPCGISDHNAVFLVRGMHVPKFKSTSKNVTMRKFKKFDLSSFRSDLSKINFNSIKSRQILIRCGCFGKQCF